MYLIIRIDWSTSFISETRRSRVAISLSCTEANEFEV
jgi:hypothetical protein